MTFDRYLKTLLAAVSIAVVSATLGVLAFISRPDAPEGDAVLGSPQLVLFELDDCEWCQKFRRNAGRQYQESSTSGQAPLRYLSIDDGPPPKRYKMVSYRQTPMLVLFDQYGRELERMTKPPLNGAEVETMVRRNWRRIPKAQS